MGIDHFIMHIYFGTNKRTTHIDTQPNGSEKPENWAEKSYVYLIWTVVVGRLFFLFYFVCSTDAITGWCCFLFTHVSEIYAPKSSRKSKPFSKHLHKYIDVLNLFRLLVSKSNSFVWNNTSKLPICTCNTADITIISTDGWLKIDA